MNTVIAYSEAATTNALSTGGNRNCRTKHSGEELPHVRGQRQWPGGATSRPRSGAMAERSHSTSKARVVAGRSNPAPEARGSGREEQPNVQGAVAAWVQEGLEELSQVEGQEGRWCGDNPHPR